MTTLLVLVDAPDGALSPGQRDLLLSARGHGPTTAVLLTGGAPPAALESAIRACVPTRLVICQDPVVAAHPAAAAVELLHALVREEPSSALLLPDTPTGCSVAGRLAARLGVEPLRGRVDVVADVITVSDGDTAVTAGLPAVAVVLPPRGIVAPEATMVDRVDVPLPPLPRRRERVLSRNPRLPARPPLEQAAVVVAGGRGATADWDALETFAAVLGAAVAGSRPALDAGRVDAPHLVGRTGREIAPRVYVACGVSGALEHLAGVREAGRIVAINADPTAPVMSEADLAIVADVGEVLRCAGSLLSSEAEPLAG